MRQVDACDECDDGDQGPEDQQAHAHLREAEVQILHRPFIERLATRATAPKATIRAGNSMPGEVPPPPPRAGAGVVKLRVSESWEPKQSVSRTKTSYCDEDWRPVIVYVVVSGLVNDAANVNCPS